MHQKEKKQRRTGKKEELGSVTRSYWKDCFEILTVDMKDVRPFISNFRAFVNIVTAVCILGVDFQVFPRRFGKCETYGTGLMDTGVGSFVICNAIVSSEVRNSSKKSSLSKTIVSTAPLWILGLIRLISIRNLDYQEHASEYGVHWNFFFTLAMVKIVSAIVLTVVSSRLCLFLSVCIISGYQYLLTSAGLMDFIIYGVKGDGSRNGLIDANREGICSVMGYLALYFIGVEIGKQLFSKRNYLSLYCVLFALSSVSCMLLYVCQIFVEPVSRRTANLGYFLWMIFFNCLLLTSFLLMEIIMLCNHRFFDTHETKPSSSDHTVHLISQLVNAVNHHGLVYFLLANLLTGMVNMNVETIFATHIEGFIIITLYMFILSAVIYTFSRFGIRTKIW
ncbi:glucosaminyl-phosphatidylinositol-acyltransferase PIGW-like [Tubulanus polymorphus]|uniref:glucosaminyl-phosphatidylinositol- acyltransferase PIGW-like n=1 Tax=Tubulanus polymorphus TaxID=672921 RepID=UPI003DA446C3